MIVDDNAAVRHMVRALFEAEHLQVAEATNGAEAVQKAKGLNPSLIILDLSMPVMNGLDAARALKLLMPGVPLLMFSNNLGSMVEKEANSAGISAVVCKSDNAASVQLLAKAKSLLESNATNLKRVS